MSYDAISSDFLKGLVDTGTRALEIIDKIIDKFGILQTVLVGIGTVWGSQNLGIYNTADSGTILGAIIQSRQNKEDITTYQKDVSAYERVLEGLQHDPNAIVGMQLDTAREMSDAVKDNLKDIQKRVKDGTITAEEGLDEIKVSLSDVDDQLVEAQSRTTKLGTTFANIGKSIVNGLVSGGISMLVGAILSFAVKSIDHIVNKAKYAAEAAESAKRVIESTNSELANTSKTIGDIKDRYAELAQNVGNLGTLGQNQGGLSNDEYKEFLDISNELAELFPRLTIGYDENGDAILDLSGDVNTIVTSLNELVKAEEDAANRIALDSMGDLWVDYSLNIDKTRKSLDDLNARFNGTQQDWLESYSKAYNDFKMAIESESPVVFDFNYSDNGGYFTEAMGRARVDWNTIMQIDEEGVRHFDFSKLSDEQVAAIDDAFANIRSEYLSDVKKYEDTIDTANKEIGKYVAQSVKTVDYYESLSDVEKQLMDAFVSNYDFEALQDELGGNWEEVYNEFQNRLRNSFGSVSDADRILIQQYYNELFEIDMSQGSYEENLEKVRNYARLIAAILGEEFSDVDILELLGFGQSEDKMTKARQHAGTYGKNPYETTDRDKEVNQWLNSLSEEQLDLFMTLSIDQDATLDEMKEVLDKAQQLADNNQVEIVTAVDAVDSMNDAKTAITSLEELWNQTVQNSLALGKDKKYLDENGNVTKLLNDKNQAVGFADPATINSVESAFYKFSEALKKEGNDAAANAVNEALEEFEKTLIEFPGDADKAQTAIDNLITAYIDQTDIIKNLTKENAAWSIAQLKAYGVTNAEEVVMSRLNSTTRQLADNFKKAASSLNTLTSAQEGSVEYNNAMDSISTQLTDMFTVDMGNGQQIVPNFDATWIIQNLDLLKEAAAGSTDAMWKLQQIAAKKIAANVDINLPDQNAINGELNYINNLIDSFDISDVEVGTSLDDTPMIQGLNNLVKAGVITRDSMNAILSGIGVEPKITYEDMNISMSSDSDILKTLGTTPGLEYIKHKGTIGTVKVPKIGYEVTSKAVGAKYSSPSNPSSSGGSGGGGNGSSDKNKVQEEAGESFDWIEVKIQRLEEAIARLDKQVNNVYKSWTDRNSSLAKEIAKVTEEIKAQEIATKEYSRNAAKVTGSGQILTDKQVKQQEAAQKAWTSKLQKDIESGKYTAKNKKGKEVLDTKKLKKALGDNYNTYIKEAAQEYFKAVKENEKLAKKKKKTKKINVIVGDNNKPKKSDYDGNTKQYEYDLKQWKQAQKAWAKGTYQKKIEEGTMTGNDIEQITNKYLKEAIKAYQEIYQKSVDASNKIAELKIQLSDLNKQKLDNLVSQWDELIELTEHQITLIDKYIDRIETMGYWVNEDYYKQQRSLVEEELKQAQKKRDEYAAQFNAWMDLGEENGGLSTESEAYYEALNQLNELNEACEDHLNKLAEIDKQIRELSWEKFDWLQEQLDDITEEAEFLSEMFNIEKTMDEFGRFNERGMGDLAMIGVQYEEAARKVEDYAKQRKTLSDMIAKDPLNRDLKDEFNEVTDAYRESAKQISSISQTIVSKFQEAIDANLTKLKELMDEYKNTLSSAKDLYDYQKNIKNQTDNIGNLRKQLLAYQGDDSEAARKRRQELTNQLNAAEQQLQETEWDRYINQTGEMLDNLYNDYEELLTAKLDNVSGLVSQLIYEVNTGNIDVANGLKAILSEYGLETDNFKTFTDGNKKLLSEIQNGKLKDLDAEVSKITTDLRNTTLSIENALTNQDVLKKIFENSSKIETDENGRVKVVTKADELGVTSNETNTNNTSSTTTDTTTNKLKPGDILTQVNNIPGPDYGKETTVVYIGEGEEAEEYLAKATQYQAEIARAEAEITRLKAQPMNAEITKKIQELEEAKRKAKAELHNMNYPGYATGTKRIQNNQLAWTQENASELIYRTSDGAMLTPLGRGDMVFTAEMSKRLWEIASGDIPSLTGNTKLPNITSTNRSTINQENKIVISLPNVQDYDSFKNALQNDTRFEKFIQEITIGQAMGNNTLNKRKY